MSFDVAEAKVDAVRSFKNSNEDMFDATVIIGDSQDDIKAGDLLGAKTYLFVTPLNKEKVEGVKAQNIIYSLKEVLREI